MKVKRSIIKIDEGLCDGCGLCIPACPEGALEIIDGKARVVKEGLCDGLGACLGECPLGALTIEQKITDEYDEERVIAHLKETAPDRLEDHLRHLREHGGAESSRSAGAVASRQSGAPVIGAGAVKGAGSATGAAAAKRGIPVKGGRLARSGRLVKGGGPVRGGALVKGVEQSEGAALLRERPPPSDAGASQDAPQLDQASQPGAVAGSEPARLQCPSSRLMQWDRPEPLSRAQGQPESQLRQWPILLHLVSPIAPCFKNADLALIADCIPRLLTL